jgi:hypothetical protein
VSEPFSCFEMLLFNLPLSGKKDFLLFWFDQLLGPFQRPILDMYVFQRCLAVQMPELSHHDFQRYAGFVSKSAKCMAKVKYGGDAHRGPYEEDQSR